MSDERGYWYLVTGLVIGLVLGLLYAWVISPVEFIDNPPSSLHPDFKDQYRALIAAAYAANGDLGRARARLALLGDDDVYGTLIAQAERTLAQGGSRADARALGALAAAINQPPTAMSQAAVPAATASPTQPGGGAPDQPTPASGTPGMSATPGPGAGATPTSTPRPSPSPTPTRTPLPTRTPTVTPGAPFLLQDRTLVCEPEIAGPLIQVVTLDVDGNPVPGVAVVVTWPQGEETFFTGLKPEFGLGYGDYLMTPGVTYSVRIPDGGQPVSDLNAEECETSGGERYWGSWALTFAQP